MQCLEQLRFSTQKIDGATTADDGLCYWNEVNFLKLLYFLWQDQSRVPQLALVTIYFMNQTEPTTLVALHKNQGLKSLYSLPTLPSSNLGVPAYLALLATSKNNHLLLPTLFSATETINLQASIFRVDERGYLLHRPMSWPTATTIDIHYKQDGANASLLKTLLSEFTVSSLEQAFVSLATLLRERLLGSWADGSKQLP